MSRTVEGCVSKLSLTFDLETSAVSHLLKVREQAVVPPAVVAQLGPAVEIRRGPPVEDHAVQLGRAADEAALGDGHGPAVELGVGRVGRVPVVLCADGATCECGNGDIVFILVEVPCLDYKYGNGLREMGC